jgi:hypothetical protein
MLSIAGISVNRFRRVTPPSAFCDELPRFNHANAFSKNALSFVAGWGWKSSACAFV